MTTYYGFVFASGDPKKPLLGRVAKKTTFGRLSGRLEVLCLPIKRLHYFFHLFFPIKIVVALPDTAVFEDKISDKKLESIIHSLQKYPTVQLVAIEIESEVIARALQHCGLMNLQNGVNIFGILHINQQQKTIWLSVFKGTQKIFFHLEKLYQEQDQVQMQVARIFALCNHCLSSETAVISRHNCYIIDEKEGEKSIVFEDLLLYGLSLWHPRKNKSLLTPDYLKKYTLKVALWIVGIKASLLGVFVFLMLHVGFNELVTIQQKNLQVFTQRLSHSQHRSKQIQTMKQQIMFFYTQTENKATAVAFLDKLNRHLPIGMVLQTICFQPPYYAITGQADTKSTVTVLLNDFKQYAVFSHSLANAVLENHQASLNIGDINAYPYRFLIRLNQLNHQAHVYVSA